MRLLRYFCIGVFLYAIVVGSVFVWRNLPRSYPRPSPSAILPVLTRGVTQPKLVTAATADIAADARVLGLVINGVPRAYLLDAMSGGPARHVVNDIIDGKAMTVIYCDITDRARVVEGDNEPLDVRCAGWIDDGMAIWFDDSVYAQESLKVPLTDAPYELTTWDLWQESHPDSDIYVGTDDPLGAPGSDGSVWQPPEGVADPRALWSGVPSDESAK
ncbi:MAG: DUF3179 domain-containing (seleno)protein [Pirellulaceae bacterium]|jgi:hypothetical protein|nr:DUF3179 domain-containing (seleno)protein [Pirellulaceae bacterium]MDP7017350.1 DUF3179 domain-containing (seleno)protein [Pirellulaceae bacterium]